MIGYKLEPGLESIRTLVNMILFGVYVCKHYLLVSQTLGSVDK